MSQLPLNHQQRYPFVSHLDSMGVTELVRRETPAHTGGLRGLPQLGAGCGPVVNTWGARSLSGGQGRRAKPRSPRYLSEPERIAIADRLTCGESVRAIARELGRAPSTISREIARNSDPDGRYRPHHAEHAARARMRRPRPRESPQMACWQGSSPGCWAALESEQVAHELRILFAGEPRRWLSVESLYQAISDPAVELTRRP